MNNIGKAGAIITIIASALMVIGGLITIFLGSFLTLNMGANITIFLGFIAVVLAILNIVLASLALTGREKGIIPAGVFSIVSIFFSGIAGIFPIILFLVGGILLFCGKKPLVNQKNKTNMETEIPIAKQVN